MQTNTGVMIARYTLFLRLITAEDEDSFYRAYEALTGSMCRSGRRQQGLVWSIVSKEYQRNGSVQNGMVI